MAVGEFLGGMALFAAAAGAAGFVTWRILVRRLVHLDLLERVVAGMLVFVTTVLAIHLLPLALGVLARGTVIAAAALAALAALIVPAGEPGRDEAPRPPAPGSSGPSIALAGTVAAVLGVVVLANLREWLPMVFTGVDTATFHLPNASRWIQTGSLWQVDQFLPLQSQGYYPNHGEVLHLWTLVPFHNEFLIRPVMSAFLLGFALAIVAVARELGVAPAARVLAACALLTVPIVGLATVPRAMPDILLYASATAGALFLLRSRRSGRRSDLVLAGLGLGLALGTKWYGLSTAVIVVGVWLVARVFRDRAAWRRAIGDTAVVTGVGTAAGGVWFVRNLVESGNPLFPVKLSPLGITILDAPSDSIREQVGFSIAHYVGDPDVLGDLALEILDGAGALVPLAVLLVLAAGVTAVRRQNALLGAVVLGAALLAGAYAVTPYTALGFEGDPNLASFNTRYLVPGLVGAAVAGAWLAGRGRAGPLVQIGLASVTVAALSDAYAPLRARSLATAVLALLLAGGLAVAAVVVIRRRPGLPRRAFAAGVVAVLVLGAVAYARRTEERFNGPRYAGADPAFRAIEQLGDDGYRVGLTGLWSLQGMTPVWPAFGERITNEVEYVGYFRRGLLTEYDDGGSFVAALRRHDLDLLVVGRGLEPRPRVRQQEWAEAAGYEEVTRSERLILYAKPALAGLVQ